MENRIMNITITNCSNRSAVLLAAAITLAVILCITATAHEIDQTERVIWPDIIPIPVGFEPEGIELGKDQDFFVGTLAFSGNPTNAGAIYKGNLVTGEGKVLVAPTGKGLSGLSYDARTDYLYAVTGFSSGFSGPWWEQGVKVYAGTSGRLLAEIIFGDGILINDILVTDKAVYCTDSANAALYKISLEDNGRVFSSEAEKIEMTGFEMAEGLNANGLVGDFDGKQLVIVNITTGVLYLVDTETGAASPVAIQGEEQLFPDGDGLYMDGRTLYIMQNFTQKIAVVELSEDLTQGTFVKNLVSENFAIPTTIIGFGNCIYAINTHFMELIAEGADPTLVQTEVVKLYK
jgi:DNA-binding beta-propeller fold protein YncE